LHLDLHLDDIAAERRMNLCKFQQLDQHAVRHVGHGTDC